MPGTPKNDRPLRVRSFPVLRTVPTLSYESGLKLHSFASVSFVPFLEVFPFLPAHAAWYGSVVVPVPLKVFTYSALRLITGATAPPK